MNKTLGAVAATLLTTTSALAQDAPVFTLNEIIFSAGLTALEASRTGVSVQVIDEDDLQAEGDRPLVDVLDRLPGISITRNGPLGTQTAIRVRGLNNYYTPVLINGIDMTDPASTQTQFDLGSITTAGISRIEVLYGSQSAIYGSEAIAGVINITTLSPPEENGTEVTVELEAGSYETYSGLIGIGTRFDRGSVALSYGHVGSEGFSAADENQGNTEADGFESNTATLQAEYELTYSVSIGASLFFQTATYEYDAGGGAGGDAGRFAEEERLGARLFTTFDAFGVDNQIALTYSKTDRAQFNIPASFNTPFIGERIGLGYQGTIGLRNDGTLTFGADRTREEFFVGPSSFSTSSSGDIDLTAIYADLNMPLTPDLDLGAALRYDDHSLFGSAVTGRVALAWRPAAGTVVRVSAATGFRAPSLNELFGPFGSNPDLDPEESRSFDLGVEHDFGRGRVTATLFYTEIDNLIDYVFPVPNAYVQIPGTSVTRGIELSGQYELTDNLSVFGNYTYTDARAADDTRLRRVPYHDATLGISGTFGTGWSADFALQMVHDRVDPAPVENYAVANASIGYRVNETTDVYLRVENLFDEQYQAIRGYGTSDRAVYLGLRSRF
ncbi:MAG: TonB-dependent receptor [Roseicyclus sp.]|nr:TonB-dependent receptor [Roseicyclus sp.]MBO6625531.1 TonB-dependent receptor [Roseicyclus sp.]MBO6920955.1 TonB-dependent receptor [Roseicyclus sp.]